MKQKNPYQTMVELYGKEPTTLDEVGECIIATITSKYKVVGLAWDIRYRAEGSITHYAPHGVKTQWSVKPGEKRTTYPCFYGRVWLAKFTDRNTWGSDVLGSTLTHTGTGGGGTYNGPWSYDFVRMFNKQLKTSDSLNTYSYDYTIFLQDWPLIQKLIDQQIMMDVLMHGKQLSNFRHEFKWEHECLKVKVAEEMMA